MQAQKKQSAFFVAMLVTSTVLVAVVCVYWLASSSEQRIIIGGKSLKIKCINWSPALARVDFNLTAYYTEITIDHVEVDGTNIDVYPVRPTIRDGETVTMKAYFPYNYNQTYEFTFFDETGDGYMIIAKSPPT